MSVLLVGAGYLIGSIPVAWIIARLVTGRDLRRQGSGNVGVMNTALSAARWAGLFVFLSEAAKGVLTVVISRSFGADELTIALALLAAVIGTRWSIWLRGAGGRGNTTGMAGLLLISWQALAILVVLWILIRLLTHSSFRATRIGLVLMPLVLGGITHSWWYGLFGLGLGLIYLSTQNKGTDDHLLLLESWPSLWAFITSPRRRS
jgi:glycerol-3-phosphate acyltransferase PlsY